MALFTTTGVQRQKAVSAYYTSIQILPFAFVERNSKALAHSVGFRILPIVILRVERLEY